jgi:hypothetical protein
VEEAVGHVVHRDRGRVDLVAHRVGQLAHQRGDLAVEGGGEQHRLVGATEVAHHPLHLRQEPHVRHAVGLVDDEHGHVRELHVAPLEQVDEPARGGHDHLGPLLQRGHLAVEVGAAVDGHHPAATTGGERGERGVHLHGELTGGHEHEAGGPAPLGVGHPVHEGDAEGEGLAGARLGLAADVASGQPVGDGQGLDREGGLDALAGEGVDEIGGYAEVLEGDHRVGVPEGRGMRRRGRSPAIRYRSATSGATDGGPLGQAYRRRWPPERAATGTAGPVVAGG